VLFYFKILAEAHEPFRIMRLTGLDPDKTYTLIGLNQTYRGDTLMYAGFNTPIFIGDFQSTLLRFEAL